VVASRAIFEIDKDMTSLSYPKVALTRIKSKILELEELLILSWAADLRLCCFGLYEKWIEQWKWYDIGAGHINDADKRGA
jgi:hypothetical protein